MNTSILILIILTITIATFPIVMVFLHKPGKAKVLPADLKNINFAHRGLHNDIIPENSMLAFKRAIDFGYGIEIDVQVTKDNIPVVFHDNNLARMTGIDREIEDCNWSEIKDLRLISISDNAQNSQTLPSLEEFLNLVDGRVLLLIEIKNQRKYKDAAKVIFEMLSKYEGNFFVQSFNPFILRIAKKSYPLFIRGLLSNDFVHRDKKAPLDKIGRFAMTHLLVNAICRPNFISYNVQAGVNFSMRLAKKIYGTPFYAWTVKDKKSLKLAAKFFDAIIFEALEDIPKTTTR